MEGSLIISLPRQPDSVIREGETALIPAGQAFSLKFASRYVRVWSFTGGDGIESLVHKLGKRFESVVLPDQASAGEIEEWKLEKVAKEIGIEVN